MIEKLWKVTFYSVPLEAEVFFLVRGDSVRAAAEKAWDLLAQNNPTDWESFVPTSFEEMSDDTPI